MKNVDAKPDVSRKMANYEKVPKGNYRNKILTVTKKKNSF